MLTEDAMEMNPKIFLFVNPYEVNPGSCSTGNPTFSTYQKLPTAAKTDTGDLNSYEYREGDSRSVKMEMEEFSDLGDLIPGDRSVMDELDFAITDHEKMTDLTKHIYGSPSLKDLVDAQDFRKCDNIQQQQLYIDNQQLNIEDIPEDDFSMLQRELSTSATNSAALNEHNHNNNNKLIQEESLRDMAASNIFDFRRADGLTGPFADHGYANMSSSPSEGSVTPQYSPIGLAGGFNESAFKPSRMGPLSRLNLGLKLFVGDTLNTPDILESVVSLEDDRFNFLRNLDGEQKLKTIEEKDLSFQPLSLPNFSAKTSPKTETEPSVDPRWSYAPEEFEDDDDEDYVPPKRARTVKKATKSIESDQDSDEDYVPSKTLKKRTRRISSVSSDSSKDSGRVSKYRELRDKNNEASRKSRLKRKIKEQEMESELQDLDSKNVKLKAKVEELKRMVDNFRSNLFSIMARK